MNNQQINVIVSRISDSIITEFEEYIETVDEEYGLDAGQIHTLQALIVGYGAARDAIEEADKEITKYHKLHDDGYNEMRIMKEELEKAQKRVDELEKQLVYFKCPDCSPTDFEYCDDHHRARTEIWSGGDGW